jgi:hypothetical protein
MFDRGLPSPLGGERKAPGEGVTQERVEKQFPETTYV